MPRLGPQFQQRVLPGMPSDAVVEQQRDDRYTERQHTKVLADSDVPTHVLTGYHGTHHEAFRPLTDEEPQNLGHNHDAQLFLSTTGQGEKNWRNTWTYDRPYVAKVSIRAKGNRFQGEQEHRYERQDYSRDRGGGGVASGTVVVHTPPFEEGRVKVDKVFPARVFNRRFQRSMWTHPSAEQPNGYWTLNPAAGQPAKVTTSPSPRHQMLPGTADYRPRRDMVKTNRGEVAKPLGWRRNELLPVDPDVQSAYNAKLKALG